MNDQADTLRRMMQDRLSSSSRGQIREPVPAQTVPGGMRGPVVITVASGKGGVGKSCLVANIGTALARAGIRTLLVDGDFGLANLDIILGLNPGAGAPGQSGASGGHWVATMEDIVDGRARISEAVLGVEPNLWIVPAASGVMEVRFAEEQLRERAISLFESCPWEMDVVLVDVGAGIHSRVLSLHSPAFRSVVVVTPEPTSITDAYGLIKLLRRQRLVTRPQIIVNQVTGEAEAEQVFHRLDEVAHRYIDGIELEYLGCVPRDEKISRSVRQRKILLDLDLESPAVPSFERLARRLSPQARGMAGVHRNVGHNTGQSPGEEPGLSRFTEEPARMAPGNSARFWRTLLGEVRA